LRADVRQQRKRNAALAAEGGKDLGRIVTDGRHAEPLPSDLFGAALQLHELRLAIGSPVRRPEEHEHCALRSNDRLKSPAAAVLILQIEIGSALTNLWSEPGDVDACPRRWT